MTYAELHPDATAQHPQIVVVAEKQPAQAEQFQRLRSGDVSPIARDQ
jgi:hypothetical protein